MCNTYYYIIVGFNCVFLNTYWI